MTEGPERQLILDLPHRAALAAEDFLVSHSNAAAVAMVDRWPQWPASALILVGPPGSGKSHLVEVWRQRSQAQRIEARDLISEKVPGLLERHALALEDAGLGVNETALFHLLNLAHQQNAHVLITSSLNPGQWIVTLPDLQSRLRAAPIVEIGAADDALLRGVLVKLFADRQLAVEETVISYLVNRMPRSLAAARALVAEIDARALEQKVPVTRSFAARVLGSFAAPGML